MRYLKRLYATKKIAILFDVFVEKIEKFERGTCLFLSSSDQKLKNVHCWTTQKKNWKNWNNFAKRVEIKFNSIYRNVVRKKAYSYNLNLLQYIHVRFNIQNRPTVENIFFRFLVVLK